MTDRLSIIFLAIVICLVGGLSFFVAGVLLLDLGYPVAGYLAHGAVFALVAAELSLIFRS